jgi:hypothetical protein
MFSLRNNRAWPGSQDGLVMISLERRRHREDNMRSPLFLC